MPPRRATSSPTPQRRQCTMRSVICADTDCRTCWTKSFASHERAVEWHPERNVPKTPRLVFQSSNFKVCLMCINEECRESHPNGYDVMLYDVTRDDGKQTGCPYCASRKLCENSDCVNCNAKSFALHDRVGEWHPTRNAPKTPRSVFKGSDKKFWLICTDEECRVSYPDGYAVMLRDVTRDDGKQTGCPYCASQTLCDNSDCVNCNTKSFALDDRVGEWHPTRNAPKTPWSVFKGSDKKFWLICTDEECRVSYPDGYAVMLRDVTRDDGKQTGCPYCCTFKTERAVRTIVERSVGQPFPKARPKWNRNPTTRRCLELDCYNAKLKLAIETDGEQHRKFVPYFHRTIANFHKQQWRDACKNWNCLIRGITLLRIPHQYTYQDDASLTAYIHALLRKHGKLPRGYRK